MTRRSGYAVAGLLAALLLLSGCGQMRSLIGLDRRVPDEFAVVSRAPLALPPNLELPPPTPGAPRPQEGTADVRAEAVLFGRGGQGYYVDGRFVPAGRASAAEVALLGRAGASIAQTNIRQTVDREANQELEGNEGFIDTLLFWQSPDAPGVVVDPPAEARRLANNAALGLPLNEGEVPVIEPGQKAPLEGLFGN